MKLSRVIPPDNGQITAAIWQEGKWIPLVSALEHCRKNGISYLPELDHAALDLVYLIAEKERFEDNLNRVLATAGRAGICIEDANAVPALPFEPRSFRDFMLFESHAIDAARGFVRRYMPKAYPFVVFYEKVFRKPFPRLKPHRLWYERPVYYVGNHLSFYTEGDTIPWPSYTKTLDYELELGILITKPLYNASPAEARQAIGGMVVLNDFSARDIQMAEMASGFGPVKTKNFATSVSWTVVTPDEVPDIGNLKARVYINDRLVGQGHTMGMQFSAEEAIAFASLEERLYPGELIGLGTVPGCCGMENGQFLSPGDRIRLEIEGVGTLTNIIKAPDPRLPWRDKAWPPLLICQNL